MNQAWTLLKTTATRWMDHNTPRLGAALAYYTVLSMAPLLVVAVAIAGLIFGDQAARGEIVNQVSSLVGKDIAKIIQDLLKSSREQDHGIAASVIGGLTLLVGASAVFRRIARRSQPNLGSQRRIEGLEGNGKVSAIHFYRGSGSRLHAAGQLSGKRGNDLCEHLSQLITSSTARA